MAGGESMRFKAGDRVKIKSLDWYNKNKDEEGDIIEAFFNKDRVKFCGTIQVIDGEGFYSKKGLILYCIEDADEMIGEEAIEGLAEDLTHEEKPSEFPEAVLLNGADVMRALKQVDMTKAITEKTIKEAEEYDKRKERMRELYKGEQWSHEFKCPDGYEFLDEKGNVIEAKKIVLEKKKPKWPKSYSKCLEILGYHSTNLMVVGVPEDYAKASHEEKKFTLLTLQFWRLLVCRDAYWKIAGDEMGLGKPWKPNWDKCNGMKYCIYPVLNHIRHDAMVHQEYENRILAFPTKEMRDAFYENFKELINNCKELL